MNTSRLKLKSKLIRLSVVISCVVLFLLAYTLLPHEPQWQGRTVSNWLKALRPGNPPEQQMQAEAAIQALGTNCIPTFLRLMSMEDSRLKLFVQELQTRHRGSWNIQLHWASERWSDAALGFQILGPEATNAVPKLAIYLADEKRRGRYAASALAAVGTPALPALTNLLVQQRTAYNAAFALTGSGDEGVTFLLMALTNTNLFVRIGAYAALRFDLSWADRERPSATNRWERLGREIAHYDLCNIGAAFVFHSVREPNHVAGILDQYSTNANPTIVATVRSVRQKMGF
jgi:hypothetical protein